MTKVTGRLLNAYTENVLGGIVLVGNIYDDSKGRFRDGERVSTSLVVDAMGDEYVTRNSVYRVESWSQGQMTDRAISINALVDHFHGKCTKNGWWTDMTTGEDLSKNQYFIATKLMLCVSELAEAMEGLRKDIMDDKLPHRKMGEVELADALIRICDLAGALGYDLGGAVVEKDAYNDNRADHKPGARAAAGGKAY